MSDSKEMAKSLLRSSCFQFNTNDLFTFASGIKSPIYCDLRQLSTHSHEWKFVLKKAKERLLDLQEEVPFDHICSMATAGISHGAVLAHELNLPFSYLRSSQKDHGRKKLLEGDIKEGARVLLIDDVLTKGSSLSKGISYLVAQGIEVVSAMVIYSYQFNSALNFFRQQKIELITLCVFEDLFQSCVEEGLLAESSKSLVESWYQAQCQ